MAQKNTEPHAFSSNIRQQADLIYRKYLAILMLANQCTQNDLNNLKKSLEYFPKYTRRQIQGQLPKIQKEIDRLSRHYGVKGTLDEMEYITNQAILRPLSNELTLVSKVYLEEIFAHYERILPIFPDLPPHARIGIDIHGIREKTEESQWSLLEASLFEDMALLCNATLDLSESIIKKDKEEVEEGKLRNALVRSTVRSAFNLLEGYINGLGFDIYITQKLTREEKIKLTEWDEEREKVCNQKLRDKLMQYPKIALNAIHPPLQENNCSEMAEILAMEESVRHALIHPTPLLKGEHDREAIYFDLSPLKAAELCDLVIELIDKICKAIGEKFGKVGLWLYKRDETGRFPKEAFR